ncbi:hypothetical protein [Enterococcus sp. BWR-S5]|uniref:hypothetical protein n=1 Tax=Enterococcus sp. BWR-S5 TaxID=2787714 RepID=UPI0019218AD4|nr:hypothetical protein [Enterococcus sp. BWR-S5]MBL1225726.1 hypothetical protein [Enterococcus sp. BWR-S5]
MYIVSEKNRNLIYKFLFWVYIGLILCSLIISSLGTLYNLTVSSITVVFSASIFLFGDAKNEIIDSYLYCTKKVSLERVSLYKKLLSVFGNTTLVISISNILFKVAYKSYFSALITAAGIILILSGIKWFLKILTNVLTVYCDEAYFNKSINTDSDKIIKTIYIGYKSWMVDEDKPVYDEEGNFVRFHHHHWHYTIEEKISENRDRYYLIAMPKEGASPINFTYEDYDEIYKVNPHMKKNIPIIVKDDTDSRFSAYMIPNEWMTENSNSLFKTIKKNWDVEKIF